MANKQWACTWEHILSIEMQEITRVFSIKGQYYGLNQPNITYIFISTKFCKYTILWEGFH